MLTIDATKTLNIGFLLYVPTMVTLNIDSNTCLDKVERMFFKLFKIKDRVEPINPVKRLEDNDLNTEQSRIKPSDKEEYLSNLLKSTDNVHTDDRESMIKWLENAGHTRIYTTPDGSRSLPLYFVSSDKIETLYLNVVRGVRDELFKTKHGYYPESMIGITG